MSVYRNTIETDTTDSVQSLNRLSSAAGDTTDKVHRLDQQSQQLGDSAGETARASQMLGGVLGRINPAFEEGARLVADMADSLEVATLGGGRLLAILGPIGVAVGVAAAAYKILQQNLEQANEAMDAAAERATAMVELHQKVKEAALLAALAEEKITQEQFNAAVAARTAADAFQQQRSEREESLKLIDQQIAQATELVEKYGQQLSRQRELIQNDRDFATASSGVRTELEQAARKLAELNQQRTIAATAVDVITTAEDRYAQSLATVADQQQTATQRVKEGTEAIKVFAEEIDTLAEAFKALGFAAPGAELVGIGIDLNAPLIEMNTNLSTSLELLQRQIEVRQELADIAEAEKQAQIDKQAGAIQTAGAAVQLAGGNIGAIQGLLPAGGKAAALAGPILGVLGAFQQIGAMGGAEGVEERLDTMIQDITGGIQALPTILVDVIPEFVVQLVTVLPGAIADALSELFRKLLNLIPGVDIQEPGEGEKSVLRQLFSEEGIVLYTEEQGFGIAKNNPGMAGSASRSAAASTRGRMERADGATRLAMSRAPTSTMLGSGATVIQQALGFDSGTQDRFQRRFSQLTNADTGLRGRA
jgi:hypothetical protein